MKLAMPTLLGVGLALFAIAAIGGLTLFIGFYIPKKRLPSPIVILHALLQLRGL
jgi:ABC-type xylose transport system permease subunit